MTGSPAIASKIPSKSLWKGRPVERGAARLVVREDHLLDLRQPLLAEEHVLGAAEPDSLGAQLTRFRRVGQRVGVRVHFQVPDVVCPAENYLEILVQPCRNELDQAESCFRYRRRR